MGLDPITLGVGAGLIGGALLGGMTQSPKIPDAPKPTAPPQASQSPDAGAALANMRGTGQAGGAAGATQTMLTGPGGVNPDALTLGKSTLLGA